MDKCGPLIKSIIYIEFWVKCEGQYAACYTKDDELQPRCEYADMEGSYGLEDCSGQCRIEDYYNYGNNVSFCCEFNQGQFIPPGESHCCGNYDACIDNSEMEDDCANW